MQDLIIIGAGGLGREVVWTAQSANAKAPRYKLCGYCDDDLLKRDKEIGGLPVLGPIEDCGKRIGDPTWFLCAVGDNRRREALVARAERIGWLPATVVDPSVLVGPGVEVGEGTYVAALSVLSTQSRIGRHVIINHCCSLGHDAVIGDFGQVCPGGRISGFCVLGRGAFVGSNGVLAPGVELGEYAVLGAASFAVKKIPAGATASGNPARVMFQAS
jgi:sugar O-acyltransferase (sialic acid O-acetyltransferase NeuD family)